MNILLHLCPALISVFTIESVQLNKYHPIRIAGVPEHFNLPWRQATEKGLFNAAGVQVDYQEFPGGTGAMTKALRKKELDVAVVLTEGIVADIVKGNPAKIVKAYVNSPLIWGIHTAAASGLHEVEDMRGKTYAISRFGSGSHLMAIVDAVQRGWDPVEMGFDLVGNLNGARESLNAGKSQIFFWERFMTQPYVDTGEFRRIGELLTPWPCFMIAVRDEILETRKDEVKTILDIINLEAGNLQRSPDTAEVISDRYHLKLPDVQTWLSKTDWNTDFSIPNETITTVLSSLHRANVIESDYFPPKNLVHSFQE